VIFLAALMPCDTSRSEELWNGKLRSTPTSRITMRSKNQKFMQRFRARRAKAERLHKVALASIALGIGLMSLKAFLH